MPPPSNEITDIWEFNRKKDIDINIRNIKEVLVHTMKSSWYVTVVYEIMIDFLITIIIIIVINIIIIIMVIIIVIIFHLSVLLKGSYFIAKEGTMVAVLSKGRSSIANSGTKLAVLLGINRSGSVPLLSATHSLFSNLTYSTLKDLKRSQGPQRGSEESGFR